jgi:hypothetical protein
VGDWYDVSGAPANNAQLSSATMRSEFALVRTAMNKLPTLTGNGSKSIFVNAGATALEAVTASTARTRLGVAIGSDVQAWSTHLDAIAALSKTDGNIIVANGTTFVAESGATARTSLGLGTSNSPQFTAINLGHASDTPLTRASAGQLAVDGVTVATASNTLTMSGKTLTSPTINGGTIGSTTAVTSFRADAAGIGEAADSNYALAVAGSGNDAAGEGVRIGGVTIGGSGGDYGSVGYNFRLSDTTGVYNYNASDTASMLRFHAGGFRFYTAASGTPGNAITFSLKAELTEAGVFSVDGNPVSTNSTSSTHTVQQIELGHASDTTITRPAAGRAQIEGREVVTAAADATVLTSTIAELNLLDGVTKVGDVVYNQALNPDNQFTSGTGWLTVIQTSATPTYQCTYTAKTAWGHASASIRGTSAGLIPAAYRPAATNIANIYRINSQSVREVVINADGSIDLVYFDWAGSAYNDTTSVEGFSVSWVI